MREIKICKGCGEAKPFVEFSRHKLGKDGLRPRCKACCKIENDAWRSGRREQNRAVNAAWRKRNIERARSYNRSWNKSHRDRCDAATERWRRRNPWLVRAQKQRHRVLKRNAVGSSYATVQRIAARLAYFSDVCVYCGSVADTIDHRIPLCRGGTNFPANLVAACRSCNSRKRHRTEREFREGVMPNVSP
jgi:5-methylcytosine-specific restriction endonuclease McrA